jgi:excisionase family DNA binding protein
MTQTHDPGPGLLDVSAAAAYLSTGVPFIRRLVRERRVPYVKLGRLVRFDPADLDAFIDAGRVPTSQTVAGGRSKTPQRG